MTTRRKSDANGEIAVRAVRLGLAIALSASAAFGLYVTYPGNHALAVALTQTGLLASGFDPQLNATLTEMIAAAEIGPEGEVFFNRPIGDERFLRPNSGRYWQISGKGREEFSSRSLWGRKLKERGRKAWTALYYDSDQFPDEPLKMVEQTVRLPGSDVEWQFVVARSSRQLD
jgi:hypothetical protein